METSEVRFSFKFALGRIFHVASSDDSLEAYIAIHELLGGYEPGAASEANSVMSVIKEDTYTRMLTLKFSAKSRKPHTHVCIHVYIHIYVSVS